MITAWTALGIILAHFVGDYLFQSQWMADEKVKRWWPAVVHGVLYTVPYFLLVTHSFWALFIICTTHIVIDRYRLAKRVVWAKNWLLAPNGARPTWEESKVTGFPENVPPFMAIWLMIIADNTLHILINTVAILIFGV